MTDLGLLSYLLHAGQEWDVTSSTEVKTVPVTCWDGVGSWRQATLVSSCETLVKALFLFLILLLCGSFLSFQQNGAPRMVKALKHDDMPTINPLISDLLSVLFRAGPFGNRSPQIPPLALYGPSDLQRKAIWLLWAGWSRNTPRSCLDSLYERAMGQHCSLTPFLKK